MIAVEGLLYDGRSSRSTPAVLECGSDGMLHCRSSHDGAPLLAPVALRQARVSSRLGETPRYLYFSSGEKFETSSNDSVDRMLAMQGQRAALGWVSMIERRWRYVLLSTVLVVLVSFWMLRDGVPLAAQWVAQALPVEASQKMGSGTLALLDERVFTASELSDSRQQQIRQAFAPLIDRFPELPIQLEFRHGNALGANALALPSGVIVFTDELVAVAQNDNQLLGVMAHEIGHLAQQHALRSVVQSSMMSLVLVAITGDVSAASSVLVAAPTLLLELSYSREFEREADQFAVSTMKELGIDVSDFSTMIVRLENSRRDSEAQSKDSLEDDRDSFNWDDYLSTHPGGSDRIKSLGQ
ncbi:M48 family metallopeptidase [Aestuariirhabdus sp. LZHN29]|uniref:M48 family metallopeptidase n=1 Tax=Aestuariirhabdus sp. LZHN29 TaxID=3417462 RepID=UPI003CEAA5FC